MATGGTSVLKGRSNNCDFYILARGHAVFTGVKGAGSLWRRRPGSTSANVVGRRVDIAEHAGIVYGQADAELRVVEPELTEAMRTFAFDKEGGDIWRDQDRMAAAASVLGDDRVARSLKRRGRKNAERVVGDFGVVAGLEDDRCLGVDCAGGAEAGTDGFEHRLVGRTFGAVKRAVRERGSDGFGFVAEDDDRFIADRSDGVVGGTNERLGPVGGRPEFELLRAAHAAAAAGGENYSDVVNDKRCGH